MKKLFIIIAILFATINVSSENVWKITNAVNIDLGSGFIGWEKCNVNVKLDLTNDVIVIYTKKIQIYTLIQSVNEEYPTYDKLVSTATDYDGLKCHLYIYSYKDGNHFIHIVYNNITFIYHLKK